MERRRADRRAAPPGLRLNGLRLSATGLRRALKEADCRICGACCAYAADWPRFSLESDARLAAIPEEYVAADLAGMRCEGGRCSALDGEVGVGTTCRIYPVRPDVCAACIPGGEDCRMARARFGLT